MTPKDIYPVIFDALFSKTMLYVYVPILLFLIFKFGFAYFSESKKQSSEMKISTYKSKEYLMTKAEIKFYRELIIKYPTDKFFIFSKVRLADLIEPLSSESWGTDFNRIKSKHIDFVVTDHQSKIIKAIELDDYTHIQRSRQKRDNFVNEALKSAGIEIVRV